MLLRKRQKRFQFPSLVRTNEWQSVSRERRIITVRIILAMMRQSVVAFVFIAQVIVAFDIRIPTWVNEMEEFLEIIPSGEQRVVNEGTFNITCRHEVTKFFQKPDFHWNITWNLPSVYNENKIKVL